MKDLKEDTTALKKGQEQTVSDLQKVIHDMKGKFDEFDQKMKEMNRKFEVFQQIVHEGNNEHDRGRDPASGERATKRANSANGAIGTQWNSGDHKFLSQVKLSGFPKDTSRDERIRIAKVALQPFFEGPSAIKIQPRGVGAYQPFGSEALIQFQNKVEADSFHMEATAQGRDKPTAEDGTTLYFGRMKVGDEFELHKAVGKGIRAIREVMKVEENDKETSRGNRNNGILWYKGKQVAKVMMEDRSPAIKFERTNCAEMNVETQAIEKKFKELLVAVANRFS